ncbi:hypothetical protein [Chengkuizengella axinellae]|uniref:Phage protein n=1 Tax=Chengkuizengella axinellae TaxID=3064388 RepID=A0ABT9IZY8_9BACL|nr:hypothetical protein [Chengkuizengella sp. 2205SS18-9]MDP5274334.1 hypothetical protein [Chengkuizengella sp. 2205SS18-9]
MTKYKFWFTNGRFVGVELNDEEFEELKNDWCVEGKNKLALGNVLINLDEVCYISNEHNEEV